MRTPRLNLLALAAAAAMWLSLAPAPAAAEPPDDDSRAVYGVVKAKTEIVVVARGTGTLRAAATPIDIGSIVKAGQPLASIEPFDDTPAWELAAMDLKLARVSQQQAELARDLAEDAYTKYKRVHDNQPGSAVSARQLEELQNAWQTQKLAAEFARLSADRVELSNKRRRGDHNPLAPIDGFVAKFNPRAGDPITTGEPLCTVMNIDSVIIDVFFPAKYLFQVRLDQRATIQIEGLPKGTPDAGLVGRVVLKGESVDAASRTFPVRIEMQNPRMPTDGDRAPSYFENYAVRPGMRAVIRIAE